VSLVHFIGDQKPWNSGNVPGLSEGGFGSGSRTGPAGPYNQLSGRWWDVYNKHQGYSQNSASGGVPKGNQSTSGSTSQVRAQHDSHRALAVLTVVTQAPGGTQASGTQAPGGAQASGALQDSSSDHKSASETTDDSQDSESVPVDSIPLDIFNSHYQDYLYRGRIEDFVKSEDGFVPQEKYYQLGVDSSHIQEEWPAPEEIPQPTAAAFWDPVNSAPPQYGAPEAGQLQIENYTNAWDSPNKAARPFVAPAFATVPEQHLWYDAPQSASKLQGAAPSKSIFPWEEKPRSVTRIFPVASTEEFVIARTEHPSKDDLLAAAVRPDVREHHAYVAPRPLFPWEMKPRTVTRVFNDVIPTGVNDHTDYQGDEYENKWDTDPAIRDYVVGLNRRKSQPPVSAPVAPSTVKEELPAPVRRVASTWTTDEGAEENGQKWVWARSRIE
jgi:glycogenin glucosyltransferase